MQINVRQGRGEHTPNRGKTALPFVSKGLTISVAVCVFRVASTHTSSLITHHSLSGTAMVVRLGQVHQIVRYPVKSMAGIPTDSAFLGWHGLQGDRRFAFRRLNDKSGFPWLSASRLPELLLYQPMGLDENAEEPLPSQVRTPEGNVLDLASAELRKSVEERLGSPVELMKLKHGVFDEADISVINLATISAIGREVAQELDTRRFRANIYVASQATEEFLEDGWIGRRVYFGREEDGPMLSITMRDLRCTMINLDPDTAEQDERVMKTVVRMNRNYAGAYGTVVRTGQISVGQSVSLDVDTQD